MKVLVTGASGFLGRNIVPLLLNAGYEVFNMSLTPYEGVNNILFNALEDNVDAALNRKNFDYVIHMAAYASPKLAEDVEKTNKLNVEFTRNLLEHFKDKNLKKFLFFSTVLSYAESVAPLNENSPQTAMPDDHYSASKIVAEQICRQYSNVKILRLTNCFGPYQDWKNKPNLIPQIMREAIVEKKVTVLNAAYSRDFLYSKDLARILLEILKKDFDEVELNIATGIQRTVGEIAGFISAKLNIPFEDLKRDLNKSSSMKIDTSRFSSLFPDFQFSKFEDALNETLNYYLSEINDEKIN